MTDPYNYPFIQKDNTMYLSTIGKQDFDRIAPFKRQSSFLKHDIEGSQPKTYAARQDYRNNFNLSTYVEPKPQSYKQINKQSNPLQIDDIDGARPKATEFRTRRIVNPLIPKYQLPTAAEISLDPGRPFIKDPLLVTDINDKKGYVPRQRGVEILKKPVEGSLPMKLFKQIKAKHRLQVKDINKNQQFETTRTTNPLNPTYNWRDQQGKPANNTYGPINGSWARLAHPNFANKPKNLCLNTNDIEGCNSNSYFNRLHFIDKRRQFRNYMNIHDIEKTNPSSLKKGIETNRKLNPLIPKYQYPGHSQTQQ